MERRTQNTHRKRYQRPIDYLNNSVDKMVLIKVNRNRLFRGRLSGFDEHLNLNLEGCSQIFEYQDEDGNVKEEYEELGNIIIRGDNIVFVDLAKSS